MTRLGGLDGILLVDKAAGPTSHDFVARVRRLLGIRRVGHTGTLDPMATGLLVLLVGRATRLARFVPGAPKRYSGTIRLGIVTDTDDSTGKVIADHGGPLPDEESVRRAASALVGRTMQRPPAVSARSIGGERLYRLARRGVSVEAPARAVEVIRFDVSPDAPGGQWAFEAEVSAGTYVRSLARDMGEALGCGGTLSSLRRTGIGPLCVDRALTLPLEDSAAARRAALAIVPLDRIPLACADLGLETADSRRFSRGIPVTLPAETGAEDGLRAVRDPEGVLLGIGAVSEGRLHPRVVLDRGGASARLPGEIGV